MPLPVDESRIEEAEARLGVRLPEPHRARLLRANGGEVRVVIPCMNDEDLFDLHPVRDPDVDDRRAGRQTMGHIVHETAEAREWAGFPADAVAVADALDGDRIILLDGEYFWWDHEEGEYHPVYVLWADGCVHRAELTFGYDHGQLFFWTTGLGVSSPTFLAAVEKANAERLNVAVADGGGVFLAPVATDPRARVVVEEWEREPPSGLDVDADCIVELDLDSDGALTLLAPERDELTVEIPGGKLRARVVGRGFHIAVCWAENEDAQGRYRQAAEQVFPIGGPAWWTLRLWPRQRDGDLVHVKRWP
jgi:hypothetical protein